MKRTCEEHGRFPCKQCGTAHYKGCRCSFCNDYTPEQEAKLRWKRVVPMADNITEDNITELPVGEYDAIRTLRHTLQLAERGEITDVVISCMKRDPEDTDGPQDIWAVWSNQKRFEVLWMVRWLNSYVNQRYFGQFHNLDDDA